MIFPAAEIIRSNEVNLAVYGAGPAITATNKPPVIFLHGWPELGYSWRHQLSAFAASGYPAIAFDQRGYGGSDKPARREAYRMSALIGDIEALLEHRGIDRAIFVGHDWGALVLWSLPFYIPQRILGLAGLNVPFRAHPPRSPRVLMAEAFGPNFYIEQFQQQGRCEPRLEADIARTFRFLMRKPALSKAPDRAPFPEDLDLLAMMEHVPEAQWPGEPLLSPEEAAIYEAAFAAGGFTAPLHWYRNLDANWAEMSARQPVGGPEQPLDIPALMITAERDLMCPPALADGMGRYFTDYHRVDIEAAGHWLQQERPDEVNRALLDWVASVRR